MLVDDNDYKDHSIPFKTYLRLMRELLALEDNSSEADAIMDQMDRPWHQLTQAEMDEIGSISKAMHEARKQT